jgi:hypothetical protein
VPALLPLSASAVALTVRVRSRATSAAIYRFVWRTVLPAMDLCWNNFFNLINSYLMIASG